MRLKIGEFARFGLVAVSALRYYDEVGLLKPAHIDNWTGYRYYDVDQLAALNRILALKDLGLSLDDIKRLMGEELPAEEIRGMLRLKRTELQSQSRDIKERLERVEVRLRQLEMEGKMPDYDVVTKRIEPVRVAILRDTVPSMAVINKTFDRMFDEVIGRVEQTGAGFAGPAIALYFDDMGQKPEDFLVGAAMPTRGNLPETERIKLEDLPEVPNAASLLHHGSFALLGQAYQAGFKWVEEHGYRINGPLREVYLQYERNGNPNDFVTEIQLPIERV